MANMDSIIQLALDAGFSNVVPLDCQTIRLKPEVRDMCAADKCHGYATNWACPPGCGTLDECAQKVAGYHHGIIVQTVGTLEDAFDFEGMTELVEKHGRLFTEFAQKLYNEYPNLLALGAGGCRICSQCTYPDQPCRFPETATSSMEAYGMLVSEVCTSNAIPYYHGPGTLAYVGCYLID